LIKFISYFGYVHYFYECGSFFSIVCLKHKVCIISKWLRRSLYHNQEFTICYFQLTVEAKIAVLEISVNTQDFSSVMLPVTAWYNLKVVLDRVYLTCVRNERQNQNWKWNLKVCKPGFMIQHYSAGYKGYYTFKFSIRINSCILSVNKYVWHFL
jgi:hypothetical protein